MLLEQQQGETDEAEGDILEVIARNSQARMEALPNEDSNVPFIKTEDPEHDDHLYYKPFKAPEERKDWLARLGAMQDDVLMSSKVKSILRLRSELRSNYPSERIIVFSRFLKFLDVLGEAIRRTPALRDLVPLHFNGTLSSDQRSFSQKTFNDQTNSGPSSSQLARA